MGDLTEQLQQLDPTWIYVAVAALVMAESALFVGFVLPGELSVLLAGMLASTGRLDLAVLILLVIACAAVGDAIGFTIGRAAGPRLFRLGWMRRHETKINRLRALMARRGGIAVLVGRLTAMIRAATPMIAGASGMGWRKYLPYNVAGALVWGGGVTLLGYAAGASYRSVADTIGRAGFVVVALLILVALIAWRRRRPTLVD